MKRMIFQADNSDVSYTAVLSDDLESIVSSSKSNEAFDVSTYDDTWSVSFQSKEEGSAIVEFSLELEEDGQKTLEPDHAIYWDDEDIITDTVFFELL